MKRTSTVTLVVCAVIGAVAGLFLDLARTSAGQPSFVPSLMLPILLVLLGLACLAFALPIRRSVRDPKAPRVSPFRAVRIAALTKASSMLGCLVGGFALGLIGFVLTRPVVPGIGSWQEAIATVIGGVALVILALVAEHMCTLPKDPDERESDAASPGAEPEF
ncbi:MAG: DUF3180 domain-containing protein [Microbacterium gubbeenense]|uniref:DUF3180 domain-containing protein n=1 Tax=Microbacterium gubbeenense TaxID=159896 RepID=UPI003F9B86F5